MRIGFKLISVALSFLLVSAEVGSSERDKVITLVADEWCPFNCKPDSDRPGYAIEIIREVFAVHGIKVRYFLLPWARAVKDVDSGVYNAAVGVSKIELPTGIFPKEEVGSLQTVFIVRDDSKWIFEGYGSLGNLKIGVIESYDYGDFNEYIKENKNRNNLILLAGDDAVDRGLKMLSLGRIDVYVDVHEVALYTASELGISNIRVAGRVGDPIAFYIAFSPRLKKADFYADALSDGIGLLRASGRLSQILNKYGIKDWK